MIQVGNPHIDVAIVKHAMECDDIGAVPCRLGSFSALRFAPKSVWSSSRQPADRTLLQHHTSGLTSIVYGLRHRSSPIRSTGIQDSR